jgi:hypothetical protein
VLKMGDGSHTPLRQSPLTLQYAPLVNRQTPAPGAMAFVWQLWLAHSLSIVQAAQPAPAQ